MKITNTFPYFRLFSFIVFYCATLSVVNSKTLIENGDFSEKGPQGECKAWLIWGKIISMGIEEGKSFLRITGTGLPKSYASDAGGEQWIDVPPKKKTVTISARVRCPDFAKRPGSSGDSYGLCLLADLVDGKRVVFGKGNNVQKAHSGWQRVEVTGSIPSDAKRLGMNFQIQGLGTLDVTDVKLEVK